MNPEDVPPELIRIATEGLMGLEVRRVIANVWPEIERRVRAQVAAEIESAQGTDPRFPTGWASRSDRDHAARIARGEGR